MSPPHSRVVEMRAVQAAFAEAEALLLQEIARLNDTVQSLESQQAESAGSSSRAQAALQARLAASEAECERLTRALRQRERLVARLSRRLGAVAAPPPPTIRKR